MICPIAGKDGSHFQIIGGIESAWEKRERMYTFARAPSNSIFIGRTKEARKTQLTIIGEMMKICQLNEIPLNGCGPEGWKRIIVSQLDKPWWLLRLCRLKPFCRLHDYRYWIGGSEIDRINADQELHDGICLEVEYKFGLLWRHGIQYGHETANLFRIAVGIAGRKHFTYWRKGTIGCGVKPCPKCGLIHSPWCDPSAW